MRATLSQFESLVNTEGIQTCVYVYRGRDGLRVLLIRKEFKQTKHGRQETLCLRVLLIRKEFKQQSWFEGRAESLRVLLIRKEFKLYRRSADNNSRFESLVNTEGIQTK